MDYDLAAELSKLSLAIQDARREFQALKDEKDLWLKERELEAIKCVTDALETAKDAVIEANGYAKEVERLRQEADNIVVELKNAHTTMQTERRDFAKQTSEARTIIDKKVIELTEFVATTQQEKMRINGLLDGVKLERQQLQREQQRINDDRAKLATAMKIWKTQRGTIIE